MISKVVKTEVPYSSAYKQYISDIDYSDAYSVILEDETLCIEEIYRNIFIYRPLWMRNLLMMRNKVVGLFGLKTEVSFDDRKSFEVGKQVGFFEIYSIEENEIIAGEDDKHLNFRVSVLKQHNMLVVSTLVHYNNLFGKVYMMMIAPFHKLIVKVLLRRMIP